MRGLITSPSSHETLLYGLKQTLMQMGRQPLLNGKASRIRSRQPLRVRCCSIHSCLRRRPSLRVHCCSIQSCERRRPPLRVRGCSIRLRRRPHLRGRRLQRSLSTLRTTPALSART